MLSRILWTSVILAVAACSPADPRVHDTQSIHGCYAAKGAPSFALSANGMQVQGLTSPVPFRYESAKVGYGIMVHLEASRTDGRLSFVPSGEDYFYRRSPASDPPGFIVAFGPVMVNYHRTAKLRTVMSATGGKRTSPS